jgi:hypothetical protein
VRPDDIAANAATSKSNRIRYISYAMPVSGLKIGNTLLFPSTDIRANQRTRLKTHEIPYLGIDLTWQTSHGDRTHIICSVSNDHMRLVFG